MGWDDSDVGPTELIRRWGGMITSFTTTGFIWYFDH